jgi:hypothetical protein
MCKKKAAVTVIEPASWSNFISKVKKKDLADQRAMLEARRTGAVVASPDTKKFIQPFPYIEGYEYAPEAYHGHYFGEPQPGRKPQAHNITVMEDGKKIAILHDFEVKIQSFGNSGIADCTSDFPEVFDIRRTAVFK